MKRFLYIVVASMALAGCANRGTGPQGGPKDSIPPVAVKSVPENGAVDFHGDRIEVLFNEYIQLDNVSQHLLMSPSQQTPPEVKARGKRLLIHFVDSLSDSTTYTLDFGAAVCDYTEKNPAHNYSFAFSTGSEIDTLEIHGRVYDAENLNPLGSVLAGIHRNQHDSAFTSSPFTRIARADSSGVFHIGNVHEGAYRLYALDDVSRDYRLSPGEGLAYSDSIVNPHDSTLHVLLLFREQKGKLYLQRSLRDQQHMIQLLFSASPDSMPQLRAMRSSETDSTRSDSAWVDPNPFILTTASAHRDTITLWLTDSAAIGQDTILLEARYRRTDSLYNMEWFTDTLRAVWRAPRMTERARAAKERELRHRKLELKSNARNGFELYDTLAVVSPSPLAEVADSLIHLYMLVDTTQRPLPFTVLRTPLRVQLIARLEQGKTYELQLDSAAMTDVYGVANHTQKFNLQMKTPEDYSTLRVQVKPYSAQIRVQLMDSKDQVLQEKPAKPDGAFFEYLKPDGYYLRLYIDANGDGEWTTGSWENHRQPEPVYYYPEKVQTKANWDFEEEWDYTAKPQLQSKPKELIKASGSKKK